MKCIVIETSPERTNAHTVTNEDGTPYIYATMAEARAELKANGYIYNRANQRYYINGTEYRAYIIREDSEEYAEIIAEQTHDRAARALIDAYAEAIGDSVTADDPESIAAHRVARACIGLTTATDDDRATVSAMVEAIADAARENAAFKAYKLNVPYLIWEDDPATETPENHAAEAAAFSFIEAYAGAALFRPSETDPEFIAAFHVAADEVAGMHVATDADRATVADMLEEIAEDTAWSAVYATLRKNPDVTPEEMREIMDNPRAYLMAAARAAIAEARAVNPAPIYQRYELLAYLGEPDAYDVDAIEAEATRFTADGARVWVAFGDDLADIAERHELFAYYAI